MRGDKRAEIAERVTRFYQDDWQASNVDRDLRMQRLAKFRQWTEGKDWPWEDASDQALPDMMTASLRMQDTLHNAVMSTRPVIVSRAVAQKDNEKQDTVDELIDYQVFVEQSGEEAIGEIAEAFVNDGVFTLFIPWVREDRKVMDVRIFDPIPPDGVPLQHFQQIMDGEFPDASKDFTDEEGWDWLVLDDEGEKTVKFYGKKDEDVEMVTRHSVRVFDGPKLIVKEYDDVVTPPRAGNLQIPGPSNPDGAAHVILVDRPTVDEIDRLQKNGTYDLMSQDDVKALLSTSRKDDSLDIGERQKDAFQGVTDAPDNKLANSHKRVNRLTCFDLFDVDNDGVNEDVVWTVIREGKFLVRAKFLTELYPANPPRRPFAEAQFLPVQGRRSGISMLEHREGQHDWRKELVDSMMDNGTITNSPFFFFRASSNLKPEVIRLWPGEGYPINDPKNDINFPNIQNNSMSFSLNTIALVDQMDEKLTSIGELQFGRVPFGRSSALRTSENLQTLLGQGEARPERILRRFFGGLVQAWRQIHELNRFFLPQQKQIMVTGISKPNEDPYRTVKIEDVRGSFEFDFEANVQNTSKQAIQQSLTALAGLYITPLALQLGISTPDSIYRLLRDMGKAVGQNVDNYLQEPAPGAGAPRIMAETAIAEIMSDQLPFGVPWEGARAHLETLIAFQNDERFGLLTSEQVDIFGQYIQQTAQLAQEEAKLEAQAAAAQELQGGPPGLPEGAPAQGGGEQLPQGLPPVQEGELVDETLPTA